MAEGPEGGLSKSHSTLCQLTECGFTITNYARALHYLYLLNRRARWPPDRLEDYRNKELRRIITYAYDHVPFYRKKFKEAGLDPGAIKTRHDLKKLPIIRKNDIRQNLNEMISDEFHVDTLRKMSTSGSTGEPLFIYLSASEVEFRKAKHLRANISLGQKPWDRWVTITGPHHFGKVIPRRFPAIGRGRAVPQRVIVPKDQAVCGRPAGERLGERGTGGCRLQ